VRPIDLVEPPQQILCRAIDVVAARVVRKIVDQGRLAQFLAEEIDLVQEQDDACPHEPARVDDRVEQDETLHHAVLKRSSQRVLYYVDGFRNYSYLIACLEKHLVVFTQRHAEDD